MQASEEDGAPAAGRLAEEEARWVRKALFEVGRELRYRYQPGSIAVALIPWLPPTTAAARALEAELGSRGWRILCYPCQDSHLSGWCEVVVQEARQPDILSAFLDSQASLDAREELEKELRATAPVARREPDSGAAAPGRRWWQFWDRAAP